MVGSGKKGVDLGHIPKKRMGGTGVCYLCKHDIEDIDHLLIHCTFTKAVWARLYSLFNLKRNWDGTSVTECFTTWTKDKSVSNGLATLTCWHIWLERNKTIFEERTPSHHAVVFRISGSYTWLPPSLKPVPNKVCTITHQDGYSIACFDGATFSNGKCCGAGGIIKILESTVFKWYINCGAGTNTKAELMGVWATLTLANLWSIQKIQILGDSKVIIDWINQKGNLQAWTLKAGSKRPGILPTLFKVLAFIIFTGISIKRQIYYLKGRSWNQKADYPIINGLMGLVVLILI
jgi:hypothetical protein